MIKLPEFQPYRERYQTLNTEGLRITCKLKLGSQVNAADPIMFDNLLAFAVVYEARKGVTLPNADEAYDIPLPLKRLWESEEGLPLWAASCLLPIDPVEDVAYLHKRAQKGTRTYKKRGTFTVDAIKGRWMERRVSMKMTLCEKMVAHAIGNRDEVERLLQGIQFIGKRRSSGYGEVDAWIVESADCSVRDVLVQNGVLARPIPEAAGFVFRDLSKPHLSSPSLPIGAPTPVGWTIPQWKPSLYRSGWPALTPVKEVAL